MDALRKKKKICLLAVTILFLFTFFNLILDAPRIVQWMYHHGGHNDMWNVLSCDVLCFHIWVFLRWDISSSYISSCGTLYAWLHPVEPPSYLLQGCSYTFVLTTLETSFFSTVN
jgi:hypothetical protein